MLAVGLDSERSTSCVLLRSSSLFPVVLDVFVVVVLVALVVLNLVNVDIVVVVLVLVVALVVLVVLVVVLWFVLFFLLFCCSVVVILVALVVSLFLLFSLCYVYCLCLFVTVCWSSCACGALCVATCLSSFVCITLFLRGRGDGRHGRRCDKHQRSALDSAASCQDTDTGTPKNSLTVPSRADQCNTHRPQTCEGSISWRNICSRHLPRNKPALQ